ncbi:MAG: NifU N-terminal domain-containing protein [Phycisphaerales bacterium]|nr:NifU N-terminal domain-containing protein [Phycisphaerales bacterium]
MTSAFRGYQVREFQETPNPAALKCVLDRAVDPIASATDAPIRSYRSAQAAAADPLASRLFALPGVANVLIADTWLTISKTDAATWKTLKPAIVKALAG